jgi:hypothetical protein
MSSILKKKTEYFQDSVPAPGPCAWDFLRSRRARLIYFCFFLILFFNISFLLKFCF